MITHNISAKEIKPIPRTNPKMPPMLEKNSVQVMVEVL
jgi:hypothetical protein